MIRASIRALTLWQVEITRGEQIIGELGHGRKVRIVELNLVGVARIDLGVDIREVHVPPVGRVSAFGVVHVDGGFEGWGRGCAAGRGF